MKGKRGPVGNAELSPGSSKCAGRDSCSFYKGHAAGRMIPAEGIARALRQSAEPPNTLSSPSPLLPHLANVIAQ